MSEVKVSKEVFDAFKKTEGPVWYFHDKEKYLSYMIGYKLDKCFGSTASVLNEISYETFLRALIYGYELELTTHEKIIRDYNSLKSELKKITTKTLKDN